MNRLELFLAAGLLKRMESTPSSVFGFNLNCLKTITGGRPFTFMSGVDSRVLLFFECFHIFV